VLNPEVQVLVRCKRVSEIDGLYDAGADEVIPEEFEVSIELLTRILGIFNFPRTLIAEHVKIIREDRYGLFRRSKTTAPRLRLSHHLDVFSEAVILSEESPLAGRRILDTELRHRSGALILGIIRKGVPINNPSASEILLVDDVLVLTGTKQQLRAAMELASGSRPGN
jgi:CPA2 family monovalent cation:H+ antiporter-2